MAATTIAQLMNDQSRDGEECKELLQSLPKEKGWITDHLYLLQDFWSLPNRIQPIISFQKHFQAKDTDIVVASLPKSGTTWLKALTYAIVNRKLFMPSQTDHPLLSFNSHELVLSFEFKLYMNNPVPDLSTLPEPRLFATHIPFASFPDSIKKSKCKIIYICRNPLDNFVSSWHFYIKGRPTSLPQLSIEEAFEMYCNGISVYGPFWNHMLGYWKESQSKEIPNKVLFLKYEDLKGDLDFQLKKLAQFLDCPFTLEEESEGVIDSIIQLCSLKKMKELEVNKNGRLNERFGYKDLFRKGEVGDWVNLLSPWMVEKLFKVMEEKLFLCEENIRAVGFGFHEGTV